MARAGAAPGRQAYCRDMRIGNTEVRPVGGGPGCLAMIVLSIALSVIGTLLLKDRTVYE